MFLVRLIQVLAILGALIVTYFLYKNIGSSVTLIYPNVTVSTVNFALLFEIIGGVIVFAVEYKNNLLREEKMSALARVGEKKSISSTESLARVKVLEAKIETLEKALENALKK